MKRYLTFLVLLGTISTAHGARFQYYSGGFRAYCEVFARDNPYFDGPYEWTMDDPSYALAAGSAAVPPQANSGARSDIWSEIIGNSLRIQLYSIANGLAADTSCYARGQTYGETQYYQTLGIYYNIMPDTGEQAGDDVMVYYNDTVSISATGSTYIRIGGPGTMDHVAITRGQLPVSTEPDREKEVLSFPDVELNDSSVGDWFSGVYAFPAKIGDVIGIFARNSAVVADDGPMNGNVSYNKYTMILTVRPVLSGDLDYDNDVDFYDLAKLANNWLEGVDDEPLPDTDPPTPDPVKWASAPKETYCKPEYGQFGYCAAMTAAVATDPSGGVQYYFQCTTESGFSSNWQGSPFYEVQVGSTGQYHRFRVKARDIHNNESHNWSTELTAAP